METPRTEAFYWVTILFSQTPGTALGDWMADTNGLGFGGGALVLGAAIVLLVLVLPQRPGLHPAVQPAS